MNGALLTVLIIVGVLLVALIVLALVGKKMQKKQDASKEQMKAASQSMSILVIDKKRMKLKEANLPKIVLEQTPKYLRGSKVPIVKAKAGPNIMNLMCDEKVFDIIPVKKEVKVVVSGIYIMEVKSARGGLDTTPVKKGFMSKLRNKAEKAKEEAENDLKASKGKKNKKKK